MTWSNSFYKFIIICAVHGLTQYTLPIRACILTKFLFFPSIFFKVSDKPPLFQRGREITERSANLGGIAYVYVSRGAYWFRYALSLKRINHSEGGVFQYDSRALLFTTTIWFTLMEGNYFSLFFKNSTRLIFVYSRPKLKERS